MYNLSYIYKFLTQFKYFAKLNHKHRPLALDIKIIY